MENNDYTNKMLLLIDFCRKESNKCIRRVQAEKVLLDAGVSSEKSKEIVLRDTAANTAYLEAINTLIQSYSGEGEMTSKQAIINVLDKIQKDAERLNKEIAEISLQTYLEYRVHTIQGQVDANQSILKHLNIMSDDSETI